MRRMSYTRLAALLSLVAIGPAATQLLAQDSGIYELRCRGGEGLYHIDTPGFGDTLFLNFGWSEVAARADGSGLAPGNCSWIDRGVREGEPSQIWFSGPSGPDPVAQHLAKPGNFYSFWVYNTNRGYLQATKHAPLQAPKEYVEQPPIVTRQTPAAPEDPPIEQSKPPVIDQAEPPIVERQPPILVAESPVVTKERSKAADVLVRDLPVHTQVVKGSGIADQPVKGQSDRQLARLLKATVTPMFKGVAIGFPAHPGASPVIEIAKEAPSGQWAGDWRYGAPLVRQGATALRKGATPTQVEYLTSTSALEQGAGYHYLVTVPDPTGGLPLQTTGRFTALGQNVKVVFTSIRVLSDSDDEGAGELSFDFSLNIGETNGKRRTLGSLEQPLAWESGQRHRIESLMLPLFIERGRDRLRIMVSGFEDDRSIPAGCPLAPRDPKPFENARPKDDCWGDHNHAKGEFDLSKYPGNSASFPFTLSSMAPEARGATLAFDVSGYVEITRTK